MTTHLTPGDPVAVLPVVDYEPPPRRLPRPSPGPHPCPPERAPRRRSAPAAGGVESAAVRSAAAFAAAALRRVLEVIDRRRPVSQLRGLLAAGLVDSVLAAHRIGAGGRHAAQLRRVRIQPVPGHGPLTAAEVFASYRRGPRVHAVAGRIERPPGADTRWQLVALHIG